MTEHVYAPRKSPLQLLLTAAGLAAMALPVLGQSTAPAPPGASAGPPAYEVVSIRPNNSGSSSSGDRVNGGLFSAKNEPLVQLISMAYHRFTASDQGIVLSDQIKRLPGWAYSEPFNVEAKMDADAAASVQNLPLMQLMQRHQPLLRAALAERFQLRTHYEIREGPVYESGDGERRVQTQGIEHKRKQRVDRIERALGGPKLSDRVAGVQPIRSTGAYCGG